MSQPMRNEKEEKEEKDQGGWDQKWRRDPVDAAMWAVILIWIGIVLLGSTTGFFDSIEEKMPSWSIGFLGAGVIVLLTAAFRLVVPAYRRPLVGNVIFGVILVGVGLGELTNWPVVGALIVIGIGVSVLLRGLLGSR